MTPRARAALFGSMLALGATGAGKDAAAAPRAGATRNVAVVLFDGVELLDFTGPLQVFATAASFGAVRGQPAFHVYTVARSKAPLKSHGILQVTPEYSIDDAPPPDLIVLPGGDTSPIRDDPRFMEWVIKSAAHAEIAMSVCTGAFVLAQAGLLDGHIATTYYGAIDRLRTAAPHAQVQDGRRFVDEGRVVTTAGVSAGIDGALHLVARLLGRVVADETARYMEYHWTPEPYLARHYAQLTPGLDARGRALQETALLEREQRWAEAVRAYRALAHDDASDGYVWHRLAVALAWTRDLPGAISAGRRAVASVTVDERGEALVDLACFYARAGRRDEALTALEQAVAAGFKARWRLRQDDDLVPLRDEPRFQKLLGQAAGASGDIILSLK